MEQVWGFYVGTGFYVYEQLWSCELTECISGSSFFSVSFVINDKKPLWWKALPFTLDTITWPF